LDRTPGGSSGGAAVAAACGFGALHQGSDGAGSIRIPAAFTGVFGIKATFGRVPSYPSSAFRVVSHTGPMARSVRDAALMLNVLQRPDPRDPTGLPDTGTDWLDGVEAGARGVRVAYSPTLGGRAKLHRDVRTRRRGTTHARGDRRRGRGGRPGASRPCGSDDRSLVGRVRETRDAASAGSARPRRPRVPRDGRDRPPPRHQRLARGGCRAHGDGPRDGRVPSPLRRSRHPDHAHSRLRRRPGSQRAGPADVDGLEPVQLPLQHDAPAGRVGAVRLQRRRPARGAAHRRPDVRRSDGAAGRARLRACDAARLSEARLSPRQCMSS
ncbi:MAG: hypothetical protein FJX57_06930, partial [Alphaproteobacteria bacterium]|nr:hypothetical protein [Alphaproteobacteria bacterium]